VTRIARSAGIELILNFKFKILNFQMPSDLSSWAESERGWIARIAGSAKIANIGNTVEIAGVLTPS